MLPEHLWAICECGDGPEIHDPVIVRPICVDPGNRVLFEGTLGGCSKCGCQMYSATMYHPQENRA
jgi:hypothetical protein